MRRATGPSSLSLSRLVVHHTSVNNFYNNPPSTPLHSSINPSSFVEVHTTGSPTLDFNPLHPSSNLVQPYSSNLPHFSLVHFSLPYPFARRTTPKWSRRNHVARSTKLNLVVRRRRRRGSSSSSVLFGV